MTSKWVELFLFWAGYGVYGTGYENRFSAGLACYYGVGSHGVQCIKKRHVCAEMT